MSELRKNLYAAAVFVTLLAPNVLHAAPSNLQLATAPQVKPQEFAQDSSSAPALDQPPTVAKPSATAQHSPTVHKTTHHTKHKKKKGKSSHQAANHHKKVSRKSAAHETHHKKKVAASAHVKHARKEPSPKMAEASKPVAVRRKHLAATKAPETITHGGSNNVAYTFCLGYDNCVPTRYETTGGMTRVVQQNADGEWAEAKIDPVMVSDLNKLAASEMSGTVVRSLTDGEKEDIAAHQGKVHAQLIGYIQDGSEKKEEIKAMLRELHIRSASDLEAYDSKLRNNPQAIEVADELGAEHVPAPGR